MTLYNFLATLVAITISASIALLIYRLIASSLRPLLNDVIGLPEGSEYYLRTLLLVLVLTALGNLVQLRPMSPATENATATASTAALTEQRDFMEYVWAVASSVLSSLENFIWTLLVYVAFVTILVSVLRPTNGK